MAAGEPRTGEDRPLPAIGLMLVAYLLFSFIDTGTKWLSLAAIPALQLAFMRYIGHFCISLSLVGRGSFQLSRFACDRPVLVVLRGALLMLSTVFNFFAVRYLPLSLTGTILFSAPIIVCALSWPLLREPVGPYRWFAIFLGFVGILVAIRPFSEDFHWAVFLSLAGAVSFALYSILTRKLSGIVSTDILQFYSGLVGTAVLLPFALYEWQSPVGTVSWLIMISLGFFGWAGHELLTRAMGLAPANLLMPFGYSFILYLTLWSFLIFNDVPDVWTLLGAAIIIVAGLIIWFRESQLHRKRRLESLP